MKRWLAGIGIVLAVAALVWAFFALLKHERQAGAGEARAEQAAVNQVAQGHVAQAAALSSQRHAAAVQTITHQAQEATDAIDAAPDLDGALDAWAAGIDGLRAPAAAQPDPYRLGGEPASAVDPAAPAPLR